MWINEGRECSTHTVPQQFLPALSDIAVPSSSMSACHHVSVGMVHWDIIWGWILFYSAQAITWTLVEGRYYSICGYYSRKYGNCFCCLHVFPGKVFELGSSFVIAHLALCVTSAHLKTMPMQCEHLVHPLQVIICMLLVSWCSKLIYAVWTECNVQSGFELVQI